TAVHEGEALTLDQRLRDRLAVQFDQLRLVIEELELARAAGHEEKDDILRARRMMAHVAGNERRIGAEEPLLIQHRRECDAAQADATAAEEMPPRHLAELVVREG